jgi:hypothetical protein
MDTLHLFLSPHTPFSKIMERSETILKQLQRQEDTLPYALDSAQHMHCQVCGNRNETYTITDEYQGMIICLGTDGQGCGNVLQECLMKTSSTSTFEDNPFELFSPQAHFKSDLHSNQHKSFHINHLVEKNLSRFGREDTVTSDHYKDKQRTEAYSLLDQVSIHTPTDMNTINQVKLLFHQYRTKMYRIHKLEVALLALFYIVLNHK